VHGTEPVADVQRVSAARQGGYRRQAPGQLAALLVVLALSLINI